jgi:hypothetical protein
LIRSPSARAGQAAQKHVRLKLSFEVAFSPHFLPPPLIIASRLCGLLKPVLVAQNVFARLAPPMRLGYGSKSWFEASQIIQCFLGQNCRY